jgi:CheY-like chemotaxis protein
MVTGKTISASLSFSLRCDQTAGADRILDPNMAFTSYVMMGDCETAIKAGSTEYIEKSINPETIIGR